MDEDKNEKLDKELDEFLGNTPKCDPKDPTCVIPTTDGLLERTAKKFVIADGRQLLK